VSSCTVAVDDQGGRWTASPAGIDGRLLDAMRLSLGDLGSRSKSPQIVYTLDDNDASTAWIDPNPTIGTKLQFQFPAKLPPDLNGTPFYGFDIANEVIRPSKAFKDYARIKKPNFSTMEKRSFYVVFGDTYRWQHVNFADIMANQGDNMILEILDVYPGTKSPNAALTEIILQGAH
jgi:hypothetical protein